MFKKKTDIYNFIIILVVISITIVLYNKLPDQIPMHWNFAGEVDGYGSRLVGSFMIPFLMITIWIGMNYLPKIDPRKDNYKKFSGSYSIVNSVLITFFFIIQMVVLLTSLGSDISINKIIPLLIAVLFIVIGNYLPKAKSNFFYGIKTPWTLSSDISWRKTHRLGGKLFILSGVIIILTTVLLDTKMAGIILLATLSLMVIIVMVASYFYAKEK